jgi:hypothetical protein
MKADIKKLDNVTIKALGVLTKRKNKKLKIIQMQ